MIYPLPRFYALSIGLRFAASPTAQLEFFYERSPWYLANGVGKYPVRWLLSLEEGAGR